MIKEVTITRVFKHETNKDGIAYMIKNGANAGKPFTRISVKTDITGEEVYSNNAMAGRPELNIQVGDKVILNLTEDNGFKNFKFPTKVELDVYKQFTGV